MFLFTFSIAISVLSTAKCLVTLTVIVPLDGSDSALGLLKCHDVLTIFNYRIGIRNGYSHFYIYLAPFKALHDTFHMVRGSYTKRWFPAHRIYEAIAV